MARRHSSIETSHGKRRVRMPTPGDTAGAGLAVVTAPHRDEVTGRFQPGNDFSRLRILRGAYEVGFVGLNPEKVSPWLRPFVELANRDAGRLIEEMVAAGSPSLTGLAEQAANALAFARGLQALAAEADAPPKAQENARHWMREYRQFVLALRAEARIPRATEEASFAADVARANAEAIADGDRRREAELRARAEAEHTEEPSDAPSTVEPPIEENDPS